MDSRTTSRSYDHASGARVEQMLASTTHGVDIYHRVFSSMFGASVIDSSEESIFLVRTPNYLVLFPAYAEYQVLLDSNQIYAFLNFLNLLRI